MLSHPLYPWLTYKVAFFIFLSLIIVAALLLVPSVFLMRRWQEIRAYYNFKHYYQNYHKGGLWGVWWRKAKRYFKLSRFQRKYVCRRFWLTGPPLKWVDRLIVLGISLSIIIAWSLLTSGSWVVCMASMMASMIVVAIYCFVESNNLA